jgi:hypothetical protein
MKILMVIKDWNCRDIKKKVLEIAEGLSKSTKAKRHGFEVLLEVCKDFRPFAFIFEVVLDDLK